MAGLVGTWFKTRKAKPEQFEQLMNDSYRSAYNLAYRLTGNQTDAEDLLQDAYVRAYRFFHRYDSDLPFNSWLFRIITNVHIDTVRRKKRLRTNSLDHAGPDGQTSREMEDPKASADGRLMENTLAEPLQKAMEDMNPDFRAAVMLADVECLSYEEIADVMDTSVGTVRSRVHRGRKQLRRNLDRMGVIEQGGYLG